MEETTPPEALDAPEPSKRDDLFIITLVVSGLAMVAAIVGIGFGMRAIDESKGGVDAGAGGPVSVSLTEFAITPASAPAGGSLQVSNDGSIVHNLAVEGADLQTADLNAGESEQLALTGLTAGEYTMYCTIAGHRSAGMEAPLTVTEGEGGGTGTGEVAAAGETHAGHTQADFEAMQAAMEASAGAFPATTVGKGNQVLAPTEVLPDGTKVFDLTMELADWEIAPGEVVEAWTFNGMVPAPVLDLEVGDSVQVRVKNDLPLPTDVHWHGLNVTNANDGVAPYTQPFIQPGETFTYEFVTDEQAVAMYHPHAHGHFLLPNGMFGAVLVGDIALPRGQTVGLEQVPADVQIAQEIPMVLNDSGVIGYSLNGKSFPATEPYTGKVGDWILVHYFNEGTQIHPMHLHQFDQIVVAKDGYPVDAPYTADVVNVAPGERYSVLVQLDAPGTWVWHCHILPHVESEEKGMFGMVTALIVEE